MRATVGISAEQSVVRGVLLPCEPGPDEPVAGPRTFTEEATAAEGVVPRALDAIVAGVDPDIRIENVAVVYRTPEERKAFVSELSEGGWRSASLVSSRSALSAAARQVPGLAGYGTVLMLEVLDKRTSYALLGPDRTGVLASDTWQPGIVDAESARVALPRVRGQWDEATGGPDAVVLCGAAAVAAVATALEEGLGIPVVVASDPANAAARGAALIAGGQVAEETVLAAAAGPAAAASRIRVRRPVLIATVAAAVAAVLGATGFAMAQIRSEHPETSVSAGSTSSAPVTPTLAPSTAAGVAAPPPASEPAPAPPVEPPPAEPPPPEPVAAPEAPAPTPAYTAPAPAPRRPHPPAPAPTTTTEEPPTEEPPVEQAPPAPAPAPTPSKVGAPDSGGLFPGETPPPAAGSNPEAERQWWDNHWSLKQRWLTGN